MAAVGPEGDESDRGGDDEVEEDAEDPARTIRLLRMNLRYYKTRYHAERALRKHLEKELTGRMRFFKMHQFKAISFPF